MPDPDVRAAGGISSITNRHDEQDFDGLAVPPTRRSRFAVRYNGTFYGEDAFALSIAPFRRWQARYPEDLARVEFFYAGASGAAFDRGELPFFAVRNSGYVSHRAAIAARLDGNLQWCCLPPPDSTPMFTAARFSR